jgi:exodeoxyribonuclease-3
VKVITWNVNGIRARQRQVLDLIETERPDIVCLQELKAKSEQVPADLCSLAGYSCYWHGASAYSGVGLHVRDELALGAAEFTHPHFDYETRIVAAALGKLVVASVYVPNGGKDYAAKIQFLGAMQVYAANIRRAGGRLLLCGDLNVARTERDVHPRERRLNAIGQRPDERKCLEQIIAEGMVDVGRALDPDNDRLFTWWAPWRNLRQRNIGWRLDYILASDVLARCATDCRVLREFGTSDHGPVIASFALE